MIIVTMAELPEIRINACFSYQIFKNGLLWLDCCSTWVITSLMSTQNIVMQYCIVQKIYDFLELYTHKLFLFNSSSRNAHTTILQQPIYKTTAFLSVFDPSRAQVKFHLQESCIIYLSSIITRVLHLSFKILGQAMLWSVLWIWMVWHSVKSTNIFGILLCDELKRYWVLYSNC